jgi:hypothetical protein
MKLSILLVTFCVVTLMCSCSDDPLVGDNDVQLIAGYHLIRLNEDDVEVAREDKELHLCIPAKVVQIAWDTNVIAAKQQHLKDRNSFPGDTLPVPVPGEFSYWIIEIKATNCSGPLTETEYNLKLRSLGQEKLSLRDVSTLN